MTHYRPRGNESSKSASKEQIRMCVLLKPLLQTCPAAAGDEGFSFWKLYQTSKDRRVFFRRWRVRGAGRDKSGTGNELRTILVYCFFLHIWISAELHVVRDGFTDSKAD